MNSKTLDSQDDTFIQKLEFECPREKFAKQAQLICEAIPPQAIVVHFECPCCDKGYLRINLFPNYPSSFRKNLNKCINAILADRPSGKGTFH